MNASPNDTCAACGHARAKHRVHTEGKCTEVLGPTARSSFAARFDLCGCEAFVEPAELREEDKELIMQLGEMLPADVDRRMTVLAHLVAFDLVSYVRPAGRAQVMTQLFAYTRQAADDFAKFHDAENGGDQ